MVVNGNFIRITCENFPRNRGKLLHHIQLQEKWYSNLIKQKY